MERRKMVLGSSRLKKERKDGRKQRGVESRKEERNSASTI